MNVEGIRLIKGPLPPALRFTDTYKMAILICMKTTVILKEELIEKARKLTNIQEKTSLIHEGLRVLIEKHSKKRLAELGGTEVYLNPIYRRKSAKRK